MLSRNGKEREAHVNGKTKAKKGSEERNSLCSNWGERFGDETKRDAARFCKFSGARNAVDSHFEIMGKAVP